MRIAPLLATLAALVAASAAAQDAAPRTTLVDLIERARDAGVEIAYSTQLVRDDMSVEAAGTAEAPLDAVRRALAEFGLALAPGTGNRWLVVRARKPGSAPRETDGAPVPALQATTPLAQVVVTASRHTLYETGDIGDQYLTGEEIRRMPHMADDAFRAFQRLPGVSASDFKAPFNLRGGTAEELKVELNGYEIANPYHMRVLYQPLSIIDAGIIGQAQVLTGGFTAEHGNYMSGVIDITSDRPTTEPVHEVGVSFVSAFLRSKGEFADGRASYQVSARRGYLDLLADQLTDSGEELNPRYADLYAGLDYAVNEAVTLSAHALVGNDDVHFVDPGDGEDFGENSDLYYLWATAELKPSAGLSGRNTVFLSKVDTTEDGSQINPPSEQILRYYRHDYRSAGLQSDWQLTLDDRRMFKFGARYRDLSAEYDFHLDSIRQSDIVDNDQPVTLVRDITTDVDGADYGAYAAYRQRIGERVVGELGLRWDRQTYADTGDDSQLSPRVNLLYELSDRAELRVAWGEFYQPQAIENLQVPDGDTVFSDAERAEHRVLGFTYRFPSGIDLRTDLYDKRYRNPRHRYENLFDIYEFSPESNFDRVRIDPDSSRAYGAEFMLRSRRAGAFNWWLNYSWARADDSFADGDVPRSWDQRHAVTASIAWQGAKWSFSAIGRWHSGWPRTPLVVTPVLDGGGNVIGADVDLTPRNEDRYKDYSRFDMRLSRYVALDRGSFQYYFELFNVFDTKNPCCTSEHRLIIGPSLSVTPTVDDYLPLFPSFGFVWQFGPGAQSGR